MPRPQDNKLSQEMLDLFMAQTRELNGEIIRERSPWNTEVTADSIRHFCDGIGDDNPRWLSGTSHTAPPAYLASVLYPVIHGAPLELPLASLILELEYRWHQSIVEGNQIDAVARQKDVFERKRNDGTRSIFVIGETEYRNQHGQRVAEAESTMMRLSQNNNRNNNSFMLVDRAIHEYTPAELEAIGESLRLECENRSMPNEERFGNDVEPGAELPELVRGPLTIGDLICWHAAIGPSYRAGPPGYRDALAAPHSLVRNPVTGWRVKYSQEHEDFLLASHRGMPAPFDNGVMRFASLSPLLTNWMGKSGFLQRLSVQVLAPNLYGDTTWYRGTVTKKTAGTIDGTSDGFIIEVAITGINQLGETTTTGEAELFLPVKSPLSFPSIDTGVGKVQEPDPNIDNRCIHELVEQRLCMNPDRTALISPGRNINSATLQARVDDLAGRLRNCGVGIDPDNFVGIYLDRASPDLVMGMLAVLKAGGAYLPLDPELPLERLEVLFKDAMLHTVLTDKPHLEKIPGAQRGKAIHLICVDEDDGSAYAAGVAAGMRNQSEPASLYRDHPAYLLYTSGTTGHPKGVVVPHSSLSVYIQSLARALSVTSKDVCLQTASVLFSAAVRQVWLPLFTGARLVLTTREQATDPVALFTLIKEQGVTVWDTVPSIWSTAIRAFKKLDTKMRAQLLDNNLRLILVTGEPLPWATVHAWREQLGRKDTDIINLYSQTETAGTVCFYPVPHVEFETSEPAGFVPLGMPIDNTKACVLDEALHPVAEGEAGEICVAGPRLAREYLGQAALTAERFVIPHEGDLAGFRIYRTRDRGLQRSDGVFEYLGRLDEQVKIRGHRVAPAEVEHAILTNPYVKEAMVGAVEGRDGERKLVAWVAPIETRAQHVDGRRRRRLTNNLAVVECNSHETDFGYHAIFEEQTYLKNGITIRDGDCIFDVGANIGLFALFANLICDSPALFCFEPNPEVFHVLEVNARLSGANMRLFPFGLSDENKTAEFTGFSGSTIQSGFYAEAEKEKEVVRQVIRNQREAGEEELEEVLEATEEILDRRFSARRTLLPLKTLSQVIDENSVERIDLLKVNVERSELDVLRGIRDADWNKIQQVIVKVDESGHQDAIVRLLEEHGLETAVDQDELMLGTEVTTVYAVRPSGGRCLQPGLAPGAHRKRLPTLEEPFLTERLLRETLAGQLPAYMIPSRFIFVQALPRTPAGKADRHALVTQYSSGRKRGNEPVGNEPVRYDLTNNRSGAGDTLENDLVEIWRELLDVDQVGLDDDIFEMGGDSLKAVELLATVRGRYDVPVTLRDFLRQPTIRGLLKIIRGSGKHEPLTDDFQEKLRKLDRGLQKDE